MPTPSAFIRSISAWSASRLGARCTRLNIPAPCLARNSEYALLLCNGLNPLHGHVSKMPFGHFRDARRRLAEVPDVGERHVAHNPDVREAKPLPAGNRLVNIADHPGEGVDRLVYVGKRWRLRLPQHGGQGKGNG